MGRKMIPPKGKFKKLNFNLDWDEFVKVRNAIEAERKATGFAITWAEYIRRAVLSFVDGQ